MKTLSATRAIDRAKMAAIVQKTAMEHGAISAEIEQFDARETQVKIKANGGAYISFSLDGDCLVYGGTWNTRGEDVYLNPSLGDVNTSHFSKLNRLYYDFEDALAVIKSDLVNFRLGDGYLPADDPRIVSMKARWAAR